VIDTYQAGAGTSFNMNVNEVLANRALELLGRRRGEYGHLSPNDHVNRGQSTNDTFPTAANVAALFAMEPLLSAGAALAAALDAKGEEFMPLVTSGRTHLQDAMPVRLGQTFRAYGTSVACACRWISKAREELHEVALGGSAVGTGINTPRGYRERAVAHLAELSGLPLRPAADHFWAMQSRFGLAAASGAMRELAVEVCRIANDLRLLASGPTTGFAEIVMPAVQPGSSIMPGKVNPVIAECMNMITFQVMGNDLAVALSVAAGQLELNVMMPLAAASLIKSATILTNGMEALATRCVAGLTADAERCRSYLEKNPSIATALNPAIGYLKAAEVAKAALARNASVPETAVALGVIEPADAARIFDPAALLGEGA
jgi:aspartate ammonia-lyase